MSTDNASSFRLAVLSTLVNKAPQKPGRTALMKFAYILQTARNVPLGYRFELYTYGPYDATVLGDLSQAATLKAVKSEVVYFASGYSYEYSTNEKGHAAVCKSVSSELLEYKDDIQWVLDEFGTSSASRLELVSTILFAEREARRKKRPLHAGQLCERVHRIKPHFTNEVISETINELQKKQLIEIHAS